MPQHHRRWRPRDARLIGERIPLEMHEVPSGTQVLDWTVPDEWNIRERLHRRTRRAARRRLRRVEPPRRQLQRARASDDDARRAPAVPAHPSRQSRLDPVSHLVLLADLGLLSPESQLDALGDGRYEVVIDCTLEPGSLTYGECFLPGEVEDEVLLTTHVCHPSLANDNLSGVALLTELAARLAETPRRLSYRFLFIPGTIGSIAWLAANEWCCRGSRPGW